MSTILTQTRPQTLLRLADLGDDILRHIFEYDPTFRDLFQTKISKCIWSAAWLNWQKYSEECSCPFVSTTMKWLFQTWGVYKWEQLGYDPKYDLTAPNLFCKKNYFPTNIVVINHPIYDDISHYVSVYINGHREIYCMVVTLEYYQNEYSKIANDEDSEFYDMMDVFVDHYAGFVILV